jgi:hypothetical protein
MPLNGAAARRGLHVCRPSEQAFAGQPAPTDHFAHFVEAEVGAAGGGGVAARKWWKASERHRFFTGRVLFARLIASAVFPSTGPCT